MTRIGWPVLLAMATAVLFAVPRDVSGCAAVPHDGDWVRISEESAIIVWDEATKTEHFIRRASFQSSGYDFGFLVPTPHRPQLGEARDDVFGDLARITAPRVETVKRTVFPSCGFGMAAKFNSAEGGKAGEVLVLEEKDIGGLRAAVLAFKPGAKTDDPAVGAIELAKWLQDHGYAFTPSLIDWLKPYVRDGWIITAFKIAGQPRDTRSGGSGTGRSAPAATGRDMPGKALSINGLSSTTIRMSFQTDRPFYPYREPADQRDERAGTDRRSLRVYFVGKQRFEGKLGDGSAAWPGNAVWANKLGEAEVKHLAEKTTLPALPTDELWMTEFEDRSSPRPGTDEVYFSPSPNQSPIARPPNVRYIDDSTPWLFGMVIGLPLMIVIALLVLRRVTRPS